ncbi:MAG TPA: SRPBCC family protein [Gallionella sp.]|jgi:hypothetical protein|nr:SRPBCC family protein [Gallionella sp.]
MFKWQYSETVDTSATSKQIWSIWTDAQNWPIWDSELEWVKMEGPFVEGTTGTMKPRGAPVVDFVLTNVEENRQFSDRAKLPLTRIEFIHRYETAADGRARIVHKVEMSGLLAPLFGRVIGTKIRTHLRGAMEKLSNLASAPADGQSRQDAIARIGRNI